MTISTMDNTPSYYTSLNDGFLNHRLRTPIYRPYIQCLLNGLSFIMSLRRNGLMVKETDRMDDDDDWSVEIGDLDCGWVDVR